MRLNGTQIFCQSRLALVEGGLGLASEDETPLFDEKLKITKIKRGWDPVGLNGTQVFCQSRLALAEGSLGLASEDDPPFCWRMTTTKI